MKDLKTPLLIILLGLSLSWLHINAISNIENHVIVNILSVSMAIFGLLPIVIGVIMMFSNKKSS